MEFRLGLPDVLEEGAGHVFTYWNDFNSRLCSYLKERKEPQKQLRNDSVLSFLGGMVAVEKILSSGALLPGDDEKASELLKQISEKCLPKFLLLYERHKLVTCSQGSDECVCHFLFRLRNHCSACELGEKTEACFKDRLTNGVSNPELQQRFHRAGQQKLSAMARAYLQSNSCDAQPCNIDLMGEISPGSPSQGDLRQSDDLSFSPEQDGSVPFSIKQSKMTQEFGSGSEENEGLGSPLVGSQASLSTDTQQSYSKSKGLTSHSKNSVSKISKNAQTVLVEDCSEHEGLSQGRGKCHKSDPHKQEMSNSETLSSTRVTRNTSARNNQLCKVAQGRRKDESKVRKEPETGRAEKNGTHTGKTLFEDFRTSVEPAATGKIKVVKKSSSKDHKSLEPKIQVNTNGVLTRRKRLSNYEDGKKSSKDHHRPLKSQLVHGISKQTMNGRDFDTSKRGWRSNRKTMKPPEQRNTPRKKTKSERGHSTKPAAPEAVPKAVRAKCGPKPKPPPKDEGILPCDSCHRYFKRDWFLLCHKILKHSSSDTVQCTLCSAAPFSSNAELLAHVRFQHRNGQFRYTCSICDQSFRVRAQLRDHHRAEHLGRTEFACDTCPKKFKSAKVYRRHSAKCKSSPEASLFRCVTCGASFSTKHKLERHERASHTGEKPFQCGQCSCRFAMKCDLTAHMKVHDRERTRRYQCHVCGKTFYERYYLPRHMLQHQGIKNFSCQHCGDLFTTNYGLRKHCWRKHGQPRPSAKKLPPRESQEKGVEVSLPQPRKIKIHPPYFPPPPPPPPQTHERLETLQPVIFSSASNLQEATEQVPPEQVQPPQPMFSPDSSHLADHMHINQQTCEQINPFWHSGVTPDCAPVVVQTSYNGTAGNIPFVASSVASASKVAAVYQTPNTRHPVPASPTYHSLQLLQGRAESDVNPLPRFSLPLSYQSHIDVQTHDVVQHTSSLSHQLGESVTQSQAANIHQPISALEAEGIKETAGSQEEAMLKPGVSSTLGINALQHIHPTQHLQQGITLVNPRATQEMPCSSVNTPTHTAQQLQSHSALVIHAHTLQETISSGADMPLLHVPTQLHPHSYTLQNTRTLPDMPSTNPSAHPAQQVQPHKTLANTQTLQETCSPSTLTNVPTQPAQQLRSGSSAANTQTFQEHTLQEAPSTLANPPTRAAQQLLSVSHNQARVNLAVTQILHEAPTPSSTPTHPSTHLTQQSLPGSTIANSQTLGNIPSTHVDVPTDSIVEVSVTRTVESPPLQSADEQSRPGRQDLTSTADCYYAYQT